MDKRIKTVWILSIVTMSLIFCGQAYWLYNQLSYNIRQNVELTKKACAEVLEQDQDMRHESSSKTPQGKNPVSLRMITRINVDPKAASKKDKKVSFNTTFTLPNENKKFRIKDMNAVQSMKISDRYSASLNLGISKTSIDSLLNIKGYGKTSGFRIYKTSRCMIEPVFSEGGTLSKTLTVRYSSNPLKYEAVMFTMNVPISKALWSMGWQLLGSIVLFVVLCFCLFYQMKTIIIQRRIDRIRHEFMKNMIYEMKQPPATEPATGNAVKIGETLFFYAANELRNAGGTVIITARQAEILRLLSAKINETVTREEILNEVWGDDSYSNSMALNVQITYLRRALKQDKTVNIEAVIKKGYMLRVIR